MVKPRHFLQAKEGSHKCPLGFNNAVYLQCAIHKNLCVSVLQPGRVTSDPFKKIPHRNRSQVQVSLTVTAHIEHLNITVTLEFYNKKSLTSFLKTNHRK